MRRLPYEDTAGEWRWKLEGELELEGEWKGEGKGEGKWEGLRMTLPLCVRAQQHFSQMGAFLGNFRPVCSRVVCAFHYQRPISGSRFAEIAISHSLLAEPGFL